MVRKGPCYRSHETKNDTMPCSLVDARNFCVSGAKNYRSFRAFNCPNARRLLGLRAIGKQKFFYESMQHGL
jgi:hypothetical protein